MADEVMKVEEKKQYTFLESLGWHLMSRRSRMAFGAIIAAVLVKSKWLGMDAAAAEQLSMEIIAVASMLIWSISNNKNTSLENKENM